MKDTKRFTKADVYRFPSRYFRAYKKVSLTRAMRIEGPFEVEVHEGYFEHCEDGYIVLDELGHPYPVEKTVFNDRYAEI